MENLVRWWLGAGTLLYAVAFVYAGRALWFRRRYLRPVLFAIVGGGFALQTIGLVTRGWVIQRCPVTNPFETLQFITWSLIILYMVTGPAFRVSLLGFFSSGLACLLAVGSLVTPGLDTVAEAGLRLPPAVEGHISLAIFCYGIFGLLALTSLMFLLQHHALRMKLDRPIYRTLPSMHDLERINLRLLAVGTAVYTSAVVWGFAIWLADPGKLPPFKMAAAIAVWIAYLTIGALAMGRRWRGRRLAVACLILFFIALFSLGIIEASRGKMTDRNLQTVAPGHAG